MSIQAPSQTTSFHAFPGSSRNANRPSLKLKGQEQDSETYICMATQPLTLKSAYHLIYQQYHAQAYVAPEPTKLHMHFWNALPDTYTLVAKKQKRIIGTVTYIMDSSAGLPMNEIAGAALNLLRSDRRRLCEISGLAIDSAVANPSILMNIFQYGLKLSTTFCRATDFVITINPRHAAFYKKLLCFEQIGGVHAYSKVRNAPGIPMRLNLETLRKIYFDKYGHFKSRRNLHKFFFINKQQSNADRIRKDLKERNLELTPPACKRLYKDVLTHSAQYENFCDQWTPHWNKSAAFQ